MRDELWIKHDARSRLDPKMARFIKYEGMLGYGIFWALIELLHYQNDHEFDLDADFEGIADALKVSEIDLRRVIENAILTGLFKLQNGRVFQSRLKQEQAERSRTKQNAGRLGGLKSGEIRRERAQELEMLKVQNTESIQLESKQVLQADEATKLEEREEKRIYKNKSKGDTPLPPPSSGFCFPEKWGDRAKASFEKWVAYRKALRKPLKPQSYQAQINHYADNPRLFAALVDRAELNGWQGLNEQIPLETKNEDSKNAPRKSQNIINQERSIDAMKQIMEECGYETGRNDPNADKV